MTSHSTFPWNRSAANRAVIGGLALLIIAACFSAFSMLVWGPAVDHTAAAFSIVVSSPSGPVRPDVPR